MFSETCFSNALSRLRALRRAEDNAFHRLRPASAGGLRALVSIFDFCGNCGRSFFLDASSAFLTQRRLKKMSKRPEMRRDGTTFVPRVRGSSESISPTTAGKLEQAARRDKSGKAKNNERKLSYENSESYIHDSPVRACVLWALPTSAKRHRHTRSRFSSHKQHSGWARRPWEPHHRSIQFGIWLLVSPVPKRCQL